jgi:hypothetical protein
MSFHQARGLVNVSYPYEVIFDSFHDGHVRVVRVMRLITPADSSGAQGEPLTGAWTYDNIP